MWMAVAAMETRQGRASAGCPLQLGGIMVNAMCQLNWECTAQTLGRTLFSVCLFLDGISI